MPPKSKKQQEEEAKRLEAQRLKQQQQDRILQLEKAKYASVQISTGLTLPVTTILLKEFSKKPIQFVKEKLMQYLQDVVPNIESDPIKKSIVLNQLLYNILFAIQNFGVTHKDEKIREQNFQKARVFVGIMLEVMKSNHPWFKQEASDQVKSKAQDWSLFKELILKHSYDSPPEKLKYFDKELVQKIIEFAERGYFGHCNLLLKFDKFEKKQEVKMETIFVDRPQLFRNTKQTSFTDLVKQKLEDEKTSLLQQTSP